MSNDLSNLNARWRTSFSVIYNKVDEELVLLNPENGFYFTIDSIGSRIWEILSIHPSTVEELTDQLVEEYEVDNETCMKDVQEFLNDMASKKLVLPVELENPPEK